MRFLDVELGDRIRQSNDVEPAARCIIHPNRANTTRSPEALNSRRVRDNIEHVAASA
jgi:hypothetical protein